MIWVYDPHSGGIKIPKNEHEEICRKAEHFAKTRSWYSDFFLQLRFKNQFCYIDGVDRKNNQSFPLCRLRYFNKKEWSLSLYTYSNDRYESCVFSNSQTGTLEEAIEICEGYLQESF